jgi:hypothetical protein
MIFIPVSPGPAKWYFGAHGFQHANKDRQSALKVELTKFTRQKSLGLR